MVEINNQRKASSICWRGRRELITDVRKPKSWLWRHCRRRAIYWLLRSPSQTCHAKPKTQINRRRRYQLLSRWWDAHRKQPERLLSEKSGRCVALQQIKERGALPCDWSWWYPSGNRPFAAISASTAGRWLWSSEHKADSLIAKFKEAGGTVREIDVWAESPRLSPALVICIIVCLSWAVNHYRDNAITHKKPSATKMPENWSWRTRQLPTCRCVSVMLLRSMQGHTKELADAKAENDALRDDVAAGRHCWAYQSSLSVSAAPLRLRRG